MDTKNIPHIGNIGEGDRNADWIKHARDGASNRNELRAHARLALQYAEENGDALVAKAAQEQLAELGEEDEQLEPYTDESSSLVDTGDAADQGQPKGKGKKTKGD